MARAVEVSVSQDDIDQGARKDSSRCVVATAIARAFPHSTKITVDVHSIKFTDGSRRFTYLTPPSVMDYIVAFDAGDDLHPFRFRLRNDQRLVQQRRVLTPEGQQLDTARQRVRDRKRKLDKLTDDGEATSAQIEVASDAYAAALADVERLAVAAGAPPSGELFPSPVKRPRRYRTPIGPREDMGDIPPEQVKKPQQGRASVFRRGRREYGSRTMRVNQHDDKPGDFRGPLDDDAQA